MGGSLTRAVGVAALVPRFVWPALLLVLCTSCYTVPGSVIAERYDTIYVPTLKNGTFEPGLHTRVTRALRRELQNKGQLQIVNTEEQADLVLIGTVTDYTVRATSFDDDDNPLQFRVSVGGNVRVNDTATGETVWQSRRLMATDFYQVQLVRAARQREEGLDEAAEEFAEKVVYDFIDSAW